MAVITGSGGNDVLAGTAADDQLNGLAGFDAASIAALSSAATFTLDAQNHWVVASPQGTDTLAGMEAVQFAGGDTVRFGTQFRINGTTAGSQAQPVSAGLADGGFVTAWTGGSTGSYAVFVQQFDANGVPTGPETPAGAPATVVDTPSIARLANGSYVVSWNALTSTQDWDVHAQLFDGHGARVGAEAVVNVDTFDAQRQGGQAIAPLNDGGYMIMWASPNQGLIGVQAFDASGAARPRTIAGFGVIHAQEGPAIVPRWDGGSQAIWREGAQLAQEAVDNRGVPETFASSFATVSEVANPRAAQLPDGGWVVVWSANSDIFMQRFDRAGAPDAAAKQVNPTDEAWDYSPSIAVLADGGTVVGWLAETAGAGTAACLQRYDASGAALGGPTLVAPIHPFARSPAGSTVNVAALADGGFLVTLTDGDGSAWGIFGERFDAAGVPVSSGSSLVGDEHDNVIHFAGTPLGAQTVTLYGGDGRDLLTGWQGNDVLDGGSGIDTAAYAAARSQYTVAIVPGGYTVSGPDGNDTLVGVERIHFSDVNVAIDVAGHGGQAYRLYQAAFDRAPDSGGLGWWIGSLDAGVPLSQVAQFFMDSPEFQAKYGTPDATQFVTQLYANVLHRAPDEGGQAYWIGHLENGDLSRAETLMFFSESAENQAALVGVMQQGMVYTA